MVAFTVIRLLPATAVQRTCSITEVDNIAALLQADLLHNVFITGFELVEKKDPMHAEENLASPKKGSLYFIKATNRYCRILRNTPSHRLPICAVYHDE